MNKSTAPEADNSKIINATVLLSLSLLIILAIRPWVAFSKNALPDYAGLNLFSYFTVQSNLLAAGIFIYTAYLIVNNKKRSKKYSLVRGAAVLYMVVTGIVYTTLLQNNVEANSTLGFNWRNFVLHQFGPLFIVAWWLLWPSKHQISSKQALWWLIFPVAWLAYTLIRAQFADWYPYPFLNPEKAGGWTGVTGYCIGITVGFIVLSQLVAWASRVRAKNAFL